MKDIILDEIADLKKSISKLNDWSDESLFSLVCLKYFFYNGELTYNIVKNSFVDGRSDGGIDFITKYEPDDYNSNLIFAQSKFVEKISNKQDIIDIFTKMKQTVDNFDNNNYAQYNSKLKKNLLVSLEDLKDMQYDRVFILFVGSSQIPEIDSVYKTIDSISELKDLNIKIYGKCEIEKAIIKIKEGYPFVKEGRINFFKDQGIITYTDNGREGILVNISSNSLREIYSKTKDEGLFEQNFRYFVANKRIDDNIKESLKHKRNQFWFLNNGIIIGCRDYSPDGNVIKLYDFSIINGCQTTTLIGDYKEDRQSDDFAIPCKIIKCLDDNTFLDGIAESSNSQKPISERDLKSNRIEQRKLKKILEEHGYFLEIKRGDKKPKRLIHIKNEYLGQLILAFNLQMPGTARSNKKKIFSDDNLYKKIFYREPDESLIHNIIDIIDLANRYDDYVEKKAQDGNFSDDLEEQVINNSKFFVLAIIGFIFKTKKNKISLKDISDMENQGELVLSKNDISGVIYNKDYKENDFEDKLNSLFTMIVNEIHAAYNTEQHESTSIANFLKTDLKYRKFILKSFYKRIFNAPLEKQKLEKYMTIFVK